MPVAEGVPLAVQFDSLPYAGQAIHKYELHTHIYKTKIFNCFRQIELLLGQHALVIHQGQKKPFNEANLKLSEDILEDIKGLIIETFEKKRV
jgi:hypothetical protein